MHRKKIKSSRYLAAFIFTLLVFVLGFYAGNYISDLKFEQVNELENDLRIDFLGNEILFQLLDDEDICQYISSDMYNDDLAETGQKLTYMEGLYGFEDPRVISMKNYYSLLLIRHHIIQKKSNEICGFEKPQLLYFYTNYGCERCEDQGLILTNINKEYPVFDIYSFETNLDNNLIDIMEMKYNITKDKLPTIVIDNKVFYNIQSRKTIIDEMDLETKLEEMKLLHPEKFD